MFAFLDRSKSSLTVTACATVICLTLGCGESDWHAETHPASGSLMINGVPAAGALVHLIPVAEPVDVRQSRPWAKVQADGSFKLSTYGSEDGAPVGQYAVTIVWPDTTDRPSLFDQLSRQYDEQHEAPETITISEGDNQLPPLTLDDVRLAKPDASTPLPPM